MDAGINDSMTENETCPEGPASDRCGRSDPGPAAERVALRELLSSCSPRTTGADRAHVQTLAECGEQLPPIVVHRQTMRVIDGWHRLEASRLRGDTTILVEYFDGSERDAFVLAVRLNSKHGMPLSTADRRAAAARVIATHPEWSNRAIAGLVGIADKTVAAIRRQSSDPARPELKRIGRDGRARPVSNAEGRRRASEFIARHPSASLREIAQSVGVSTGTARDVRARLRRGEDPLPGKQRAMCGSDAPVHSVPAAGMQPLGAVCGLPIDDPTPVLNLRNDPRLRFTDAGRSLLRLLEFRVIDERQRRQLVEAVPAYQSGTVARVARECAEQWKRFADQLERREQSA